MAEGQDVVADIDSMRRLVSSIDVDRLDDRELSEAVLRAEQLLNAVSAFSSALLDRFDRDGAWAEDGALSAAGWVAQRTGSGRTGLRSRARQGAALRSLPRVASEARSGRLPGDHLQAIGECVRRHPGRAGEDEAVLLEQAGSLCAETFRTVTRHWVEAADAVCAPDVAEAAGRSDAVSRLHVSRTFEGWLRLYGWFAPQDADLV